MRSLADPSQRGAAVAARSRSRCCSTRRSSRRPLPQNMMLLAFLLAIRAVELEHHLRLRRLHLARAQRVPRPRRLHRGDPGHPHRRQPSGARSRSARSSWPCSRRCVGRDRAAHARPRVRDHHHRVPVPDAGRVHSTGRASPAAPTGSPCRCRPGTNDIQNWPFYYRSWSCSALHACCSRGGSGGRKFGTGLIAIREDEDKAATIGVNTAGLQDASRSSRSAVFVGMAGGVYAYYLTFIDPRGMFSILISVQIVLAALLGGRGTLWGPVLGAFILEPLNEIANNDYGGGSNRGCCSSAALLALVVLFLPRGHLPAVQRLLGPAARRRDRVRRPDRRPRARPARAPRPRAPRESTATRSRRPLLEVRGVCEALRRHPGRRRRRRSHVREGSITALIGPNGSGKTTAVQPDRRRR